MSGKSVKYLVKINIDSSSRENPSIVGAGGLIQSHTSIQTVGFRAHLGVYLNIVVELQAVCFGLLHAWQEGFRKVVYELDTKVVID